MRVALVTIMALLALGAPILDLCWAGSPEQSPPRLRRPIALALDASEDRLYVANRRSGSISVVDLELGQAVAERDIGGRISAMASVRDGRVLVTDEASHELLLLRCDKASVEIEQRVRVSEYPVEIAVDQQGSQCTVTSLWSRRLSFVSLPTAEQKTAILEKVIDLPFAPRCQLLVEQDRYLIVADAFGGRLGIVDMQSRELMFVRKFPAHNIRGLRVSVDRKMLLIAHQMLNELAHTVRNDVHWGLLMSNDLRWLRLDAVLDQDADLYRDAHMHPLGQAGNATADPSGLIVTAGGNVVVSLGGVGEIALGKERDFNLRRLEVGHRPTGLLASRDGKRIYVANTFGDSVSIVDVKEHTKLAEIPLGPKPTLTLADKGEVLFYDGSLSHDSWMSCHSCHTDGHSNGLLNDNFSDASFGAPKRVLSLLGKAKTAPFAWDGGAESLGAQIRKSIEKTMQSDRTARETHVTALIAYIETLETPPSVDSARGQIDRAAVERGRQVFAAQQCADCHTPPLYTSADVYDVGLKDKLGNHRFNPPSLRGLSQREPYFHDGRAKRLEDVFQNFRHQLTSELTDDERDDLLVFLRSR